MVSDPCPDANRKDQFGRTASPSISCAVFHGHYEYEPRTKTFYDRDSAMIFLKAIKAEQKQNEQFSFLGDNEITGVKIDSVAREGLCYTNFISSASPPHLLRTDRYMSRAYLRRNLTTKQYTNN